MNDRPTPQLPSESKRSGESSSTPRSATRLQHHPRWKRPLLILLLLVLVAGLLAWRYLRPKGAVDAFASGNGRIEAVEYDISARLPGRISTILVNDGDYVRTGQVVARMDTEVLQAELQQARAQQVRARDAVATALAVVTERESEKAAAQAVVIQRKAEEVAAEKAAQRSKVLSVQHAASQQEYENDVARQKGSQAAVLAAQAQVAAMQATILAAKSQVQEARSAVAAAVATKNRVMAEIRDSNLKASRDGRVQFRIAQPGEVIPAGGKVLSMVDLTDVSMNFFLPETVAGRVAIGSEVRIVLDAAPQYVIPATVSFVSDVAQFTPKTVETKSERQKLVFRVKARIDSALLRKHITQVKSGVPGVAYVRLNPSAAWPENLRTRTP